MVINGVSPDDGLHIFISGLCSRVISKCVNLALLAGSFLCGNFPAIPWGECRPLLCFVVFHIKVNGSFYDEIGHADEKSTVETADVNNCLLYKYLENLFFGVQEPCLAAVSFIQQNPMLSYFLSFDFTTNLSPALLPAKPA